MKLLEQWNLKKSTKSPQFHQIYALTLDNSSFCVKFFLTKTRHRNWKPIHQSLTFTATVNPLGTQLVDCSLGPKFGDDLEMMSHC